MFICLSASSILTKLTTTKMSDIKSVIALLCKHFEFSIGATFKPEYFRLAKYNKGEGDVIESLWKILHTLSHHAVKDEKLRIDFDRYDDLHATKLYLAFLRYPTIDFYALSKQNSCCSRELLLALGWLIATKNVLNIAIREKLATSVLGQEYSCSEEFSSSFLIAPEKEEKSSLDAKSEMHRITHTCGRLAHNVKEIAELMQEKVKLTTKIHAATLNTSGLPHLSVFQVALTKKLNSLNGKHFTKRDEESLNEFKSLATILETHNRWIKSEHVFYDWMVTVIDESKNEKAPPSGIDRCKELSNFLSLLRHVTKKRLHSLKNMETEETSFYSESCVSRFFRTHQDNTEADSWSSITAQKLETIEADFKIKMDHLTSELRKMLKSIPNCVEV